MKNRERWVEWLTRRYALDRADAEDLLQASLMRLLRNFLHDYPNASEAEQEAYLEGLSDACVYRTLHWHYCDWRRSRVREQQALLHLAELQAVCEPPEIVVLERLECQCLLAQMPEPARDVALLWLEGYTWREIAEQLGISVSAAKMRFSRGVEAVRVDLGTRCDDRAVCVVNLSGECSAIASSHGTQMEVYDETTHTDGYCSDDAVSSEPFGASDHPCCCRRTERGGGHIALR